MEILDAYDNNDSDLNDGKKTWLSSKMERKHT